LMKGESIKKQKLSQFYSSLIKGEAIKKSFFNLFIFNERGSY